MKKNTSGTSGEGGQNPVVTPTKPPDREHELSRDCWCQPTVDGNAPDGISLDEQIKHQQSIYNSDLDTFGIKSEWAIKSGSILASLLELRDRRVVDDAKPTPERLGTALARAFALSWLKYEDYLRVKSYLPINALIVEQSQSTENAEGRATQVPSQLSGKGDGTPSGSKKDTTLNVSEPAPSAPTVQVPVDKGPWEVTEDGRRIQSDDFDHDVTLVVQGDFYDDAERKKYSDGIAAMLRAAQESSHD